MTDVFMNISTHVKKILTCHFLFNSNSELLQIRGQQGGHVHPLHPQAV